MESLKLKLIRQEKKQEFGKVYEYKVVSSRRYFSRLCVQNSCEIICLKKGLYVYTKRHPSHGQLGLMALSPFTFIIKVVGWGLLWDQNALCRVCLLLYAVSSLDQNIPVLSTDSQTIGKISIGAIFA
jgi:hypothetical protein